MARFKILSIDGGGIRGLFAARLLAEIERGSGKKVADHFDLIVGTSTGGIIALALGLGVPAEGIARFYRQYGPALFREPWGMSLLGFAKHLFRAKHSAQRLRTALEGVFGTRKLGDSDVRLVIPAMHVLEGEVHLLKTAHSERFARDHELLAVDVAMATTAAPTYYPAHTVSTGDELVDGGVWANCPVLVGIVEAAHYLGQDLRDIDVLSLGTTNAVFFIPKRARRLGGILTWNRRVVSLLMAGQESAALAEARLLVGRANILRIDEQVPDKRCRLDDWRHLDELESRASYQARHKLEEVRQRFLMDKCRPFVPLHQLTRTV
jgi:hypothetical protein